MKDYMIYGDDNQQELEYLSQAAEGLDEIIEKKRKEILKEKSKKISKKPKNNKNDRFVAPVGDDELTDINRNESDNASYVIEDEPPQNSNQDDKKTGKKVKPAKKPKPEKKPKPVKEKTVKEKPVKDKPSSNIFTWLIWLLISAILLVAAYLGYPYYKDYLPLQNKIEEPTDVIEVEPGDEETPSDVVITHIDGRLRDLTGENDSLKDVVTYISNLQKVIDSYWGDVRTIIVDYRDGQIDDIENALSFYREYIISDRELLENKYKNSFDKNSASAIYECFSEEYLNLFNMITSFSNDIDVTSNINGLNQYINKQNTLRGSTSSAVIKYFDDNEIPYEKGEDTITYNAIELSEKQNSVQLGEEEENKEPENVKDLLNSLTQSEDEEQSTEGTEDTEVSEENKEE